MPDFKKTQNSFSAGAVSSDFFGRNIPNAASKLENIFTEQSGALSRRPGTIRIDSFGGQYDLLIPFDDDHLIVMSATAIRIYKNGAPAQSLIIGWNIDNIGDVQWAKRFDSMIFTHPDNPPKVLRLSGGAFSFADFQFDRDPNNFPLLPFMRFPDSEDVTITMAPNSNGANFAKITASAPIWGPDIAGSFLIFYDGRKWAAHSFISPTEIVVSTSAPFMMPAASYAFNDWKESVFSQRRGWPKSITFFQDRLVFGASRGWPSGLWLSKTGAHYNFDAGTGLDDDAIFITLSSESKHNIRTVAASRDLLVLTDRGEWAVSANPLTPSNANARQHTGIGASNDRFIRPQKIDGGTIFISKNSEIRELILDDLGENYNSSDLSLYARHLIDSPTDTAYSAKTKQLYVVMRDGSMAVLTKSDGACAWSRWTTDGKFKSVCVIKESVHVIVQRADGNGLEVFSDEAPNDSGHDFSWSAAGMPLLIENHIPKKIRVNKAALRVLSARHVAIFGRGRYFTEEFSGDVSADNIGSMTDPSEPLWTVESDKQFPIKILSVGIDGRYET